jgi:formylmethanofuran dehydrogenase subunit E
MTCTIIDQDIRIVEAFHGHSCPGLAIGIRAVELSLRYLKPTNKGDLVVVTETDDASPVPVSSGN